MTAIAEVSRKPLSMIETQLARIPQFIPLLLLRLGLAVPFLRSGLTKWDGFLSVSPGTHYLFANEFKLHLFGRVFDYPFPQVAAWGASIGEILFPILLIVGLFTRFAALALLGMTIVIQLTVPEGWANFHLPWAAMAMAIVVYGGGWLSLDRFRQV